MNSLIIAAVITMMSTTSFDLKSFSNHEMKIYKKSQTASNKPPANESITENIFEEWESIIQKQARDNLYNRFHKQKKK